VIRRGLLAALAAALGGCVARDTVARSENGGRDGAPAFCAGAGPPVLVGGTCTGTLSERYFSRAACACGGLNLASDLVTDRFDSRVGPWVAGGAGGDVGVVGGLSADGLLRVGGSLIVSGGGLAGGPTVSVGGDLAVGGAVGRPGTAVRVGGSARIAGDVAVASLAVAGTLTAPAGATLSPGVTADGGVMAGAVEVAAPCRCAASDAALDVAAVVAQHRATNDDAAIGLAPDALSAVDGARTLALPCGRFYLERIQGSGTVTLRAQGRAALFVGAGISLAGALAVELDPGAELDLFVAGSVNLPATLRLGDTARPSALRVWLAAPGAIGVPAGALWSANLYAPAADLAVGGPLDLYGAVMVGHVVVSAPLSIHYDRAIASAADRCSP
jgi:hypothetical protein